MEVSNNYTTMAVQLSDVGTITELSSIISNRVVEDVSLETIGDVGKEHIALGIHFEDGRYIRLWQESPTEWSVKFSAGPDPV